MYTDPRWVRVARVIVQILLVGVKALAVVLLIVAVAGIGAMSRVASGSSLSGRGYRRI